MVLIHYRHNRQHQSGSFFLRQCSVDLLYYFGQDLFFASLDILFNYKRSMNHQMTISISGSHWPFW